ncbi:IS1 family transposase [Xenorhabdus budapestensis]|uniref:IS1 family transposase n=1 Tax=Xenorhabdus budapestensis TaxID=290110 RepID=A0ABX7VJ63_XENBU|nr:IS1 family transposase [Xenorhabdus budapestensis]QTL39800.1 IS1 family transposase [Xenorhabdus budapestensis]QTL40811.1 IS1 family transposase [Xenorhabdus budapestensis]QTL40863.1 IS1 family transposase [Xenorhabdus budapestensis]QTL41038.1 IS1 family transposase [Xenorhabdus budapestensis]QTL41122.1 IS1 family transposase [Xenorhabdus budapestensis]
MTVKIEVVCRYCGQTEPVRKHGTGKAGFPRYYCKDCRKTFQLNYRYNGHKPDMKEKIVDMAMNGSGVRDTGRVLGVGINTVIPHFKKLSPKQVTTRQAVYEDVTLICELDEQWSFVGNKKQRHWLWYAFDTKRKQVIAHVFGPRTDATCRKLLDLLTPFSIRFITTDDWGSYTREIESEKHLVGKIFTQRIERHNLNLRIHIKRLARKTICYSRSIEVHEKLIGAYIEKHHYNALES